MKIKKQLTALIAASTLVGTLPASAHEGQHMTPEMMLSLARVGASSLSPDGKTIVYSVGFPNIKENKIRTELFSIASNGSGRRQLTQGIAGSSRVVVSAISLRRVANLRSGRWHPMAPTASR